MPETKHVVVLVGSLRRSSLARLIARNAIGMFPPGIYAGIQAIGHLPLYNFDYDDPEVKDIPVPGEYVAFRDQIRRCDGVLFVTSENNRCIPACLKNAIDIGSKPNSDVAWRGKPAGIISHSIGRMGGYSAQKNLRLALSYFDMPTPGQPEVFLGNSSELLDSKGMIGPDSTRQFLQSYIDRFVALLD